VFFYSVLRAQVSAWWALKRALSGTQNASGFPMKPDFTIFTGMTYASLAAKIHWLLDQTTAAKALAAVQYTGPRLCRASILPISRCTHRMVWAPTGLFGTSRLSPTTSCLNERCPSPVLPMPPGASRTAIPTVRIQWEVGNILIKGCTALGIRVSAGGPVAILSASHGDRPPCIYRGFCIQGCKVGAKASTLVTHVPDAIAQGAEIRDNSMVARISMNKNGRTDGVVYYDAEGSNISSGPGRLLFAATP
jgi:hypothetical protein